MNRGKEREATCVCVYIFRFKVFTQSIWRDYYPREILNRSPTSIKYKKSAIETLDISLRNDDTYNIPHG